MGLPLRKDNHPTLHKISGPKLSSLRRFHFNVSQRDHGAYCCDVMMFFLNKGNKNLPM